MIYVRIGNVCVCVCRGCTSPARTHRRPCPHSQIPAIWSRNRPTETGEGCVLVFRFRSEEHTSVFRSVCRGCTSPARTHRRPCPHSQIPAIWSRNRPTETGEGCVLVFRF